jgi:putative ABC transport system substrate-binding protein
LELSRRRRVLFAAGAFALAPRSLAQVARRPTVGALIPFAEADAESRARLAVFASALEKLGWRGGQNLRLEVRYGVGDAQLRQRAVELASLRPDVTLVQSNQALAIARQENVAPIVFVAVSDPVGSGFVANLARPGGNATGFTNFDPEMGAKWLQVLKELAPGVERVALLLNSSIAANRELAHSAEGAATALGLGVSSFAANERTALEQALTRLAGERRTGLVVLPNPTNTTHQKQIIDAAARHGLPAIYPFPYYARNGGLLAYGVDLREVFRLAAVYIDRILRGARPAELPVQQPTKYELVINLRAARALGLSVPGALLARADEVIE